MLLARVRFALGLAISGLTPWAVPADGRAQGREHRRDGRIRREASQRNLCVLCRLCGAN